MCFALFRTSELRPYCRRLIAVRPTLNSRQDSNAASRLPRNRVTDFPQGNEHDFLSSLTAHLLSPTEAEQGLIPPSVNALWHSAAEEIIPLSHTLPPPFGTSASDTRNVSSIPDRLLSGNRELSAGVCRRPTSAVHAFTINQKKHRRLFFHRRNSHLRQR